MGSTLHDNGEIARERSGTGRPVSDDGSDDFARSVSGLLRRHWPDATAARNHDLADLWQAGAGQGWFDLGPADAFGPLFAGLRELGTVACPLPLADGFVAGRVLGARPDLLDALASGAARVLVALETPGLERPAPGSVSFLEAADTATHVLVLAPGGGTAALRPILHRDVTPGLAIPPWWVATLGAPEATVELDPGQADEAVVLVRLGLAARAHAAASRCHELALEHAKIRRQFGRPIGSFGAVQQRAAADHIAVAAGARRLEEAVRLAHDPASGFALAAELATAHVASTVARIQLGSHHTLAATGYFEEHEAPWLFRRVHADVARLAVFGRQAGDLADVLVEADVALPDFDAGPEATALRAELRSFIAEDPARGARTSVTGDDEAVVHELAARGYLGFGWPAAEGGRDASLPEQVALFEEIAYGRVPAIGALSCVQLLGGSILRHGTRAQKDRFLPLIASGELPYCLGYSESEAGSDLASLRTRAERDGDEWVITGEKLWSTGAQRAKWVWLATRTDPDADPPHGGITVFLVAMDTAGISLTEHRALSGEISCTVTYDGVRVDDGARVGEVDGGWRVITDALAGERIVMGAIASALHRQLDDLLAYVRIDPVATLGGRGSAKRARLGALAASLHATRALVAGAIEATGEGDARLEAAMAGVMGGELAEDFGEATLELLGPVAALSGAAKGAIGGGAFEYGLRLAPMYVIGGGTNDIQRGLIARALGLPR